MESLQIINLTYLIGLLAEPASNVHLPKPFSGHQLDVNAASAPTPSTRSSSCGIVKSTLEMRPQSIGNGAVKRGEWAWLVAIYIYMDTFAPNFACGGNLLSNKIVLTAAHCVKNAGKSYRPHEILLYLGHYNRSDWNEIDSMRLGVAKIHIHPEYRKQMKKAAKDADLAVLIADGIIEFNAFIQPVCLWSIEDGSDDESFATDRIGTVVGWGRNSLNRTPSKYPRKIVLPIVDVNVCRLASKRIASALSNRMFCAGTLDDNSDSPCHGDSGK